MFVHLAFSRMIVDLYYFGLRIQKNCIGFNLNLIRFVVRSSHLDNLHCLKLDISITLDVYVNLIHISSTTAVFIVCNVIVVPSVFVYFLRIHFVNEF